MNVKILQWIFHFLHVRVSGRHTYSALYNCPSDFCVRCSDIQQSTVSASCEMQKSSHLNSQKVFLNVFGWLKLHSVFGIAFRFAQTHGKCWSWQMQLKRVTCVPAMQTKLEQRDACHISESST